MSEPSSVAPRPAGAAGATSLVDLLAKGVLDAELAALVWVLVEGRIPLVVAAPEGRLTAGGQLLAGIIGSIHADEAVDTLLQPLTAAGASSLVRGRRAGGVLVATSLEEVRARLGSGALPLTPDQLTFLGCVLVLQEAVGGQGSQGGRRGRLRVTAAHYVRPLARDAHGHSQRLDPAVLATWDERLGRYEHFAWGVLPEIAARLGRRMGDLEADLHHRRDDLAGLAKGGVTKLDEVRRLVAGYQVRYGGGHAAADGHGAVEGLLGGGGHGAGDDHDHGPADSHGPGDGHDHGGPVHRPH